MVRIVKLEKANDGKHKYIATFDDGTRTKFGAYGMSDYTIHKDKDRKRLYELRHKKDLDTKDPRRAGYLSMFILWNKPTIEESLKDFNRRFSQM
jgi:hypothetical protein